ncbi:hypothetical protein PC129_g19312 [Phytophthora cactorum]|uniref:Uncharacterized protein n=1 Tax=Phytophthora cactorum TaxID=29920 RepID=A0A8T1FRP1_9STRA|nr:hypothetical protein Pcac1_g5792 [Phytophthora cactorum]KAG2799451.1 hypothetical protein PC112_g20899 [Phytophthora cactorum]KAG2819416.1 hypothetical protein PC111_g11911 [Phytophthora cactorum]KAG2853850.1 hypothetical protein PC113_g13817 [Phytophthora cactorum]KAG2898983.1 hypothetical protein PC114_g14078 [Phytophthora cactorum]
MELSVEANERRAGRAKRLPCSGVTGGNFDGSLSKQGVQNDYHALV